MTSLTKPGRIFRIGIRRVFMVAIKRVLVTVSDKSELAVLAKALLRWSCEVISTGKTSEILGALGVPTVDIQQVTGKPEAFGGRMKTLSYEVFSAILFDRDRDAAEAQHLGVKPIDLVVCNLYPFAQKAQELAHDPSGLIEYIDVGGPSLLRAAAKNHRSVTVLCDTADYEKCVQEMDAHQGNTSPEFRFAMARKAFAHTADYDAAIATQFERWMGEESVRFCYGQGRALRYGENPHQTATVYTSRSPQLRGIWNNYEVLGGKELSYNNFLDLDAAWEDVRELGEHGCAIVKHASPSGLAQCQKQSDALRWAWAADPVSAFGSVIAFNSVVTLETLRFLCLAEAEKSHRKFIEALIAPGFSPDALAYAREQKNLRLVQLREPDAGRACTKFRFLNGALLAQSPDAPLLKDAPWAATTVTRPDWFSDALMDFGLKVVREVRSNAIAVVMEWEGQFLVLGLGGGQPNRLNALKIALEKTDDFCKREMATFKQNIRDRAVVFSDAFFPFADNVHLCALHGLKTVVQPGGSVQDSKVIEAAQGHGVCMLLTQTRHFKH